MFYVLVVFHRSERKPERRDSKIILKKKQIQINQPKVVTARMTEGRLRRSVNQGRTLKTKGRNRDEKKDWCVTF